MDHTWLEINRKGPTDDSIIFRHRLNFFAPLFRKVYILSITFVNELKCKFQYWGQVIPGLFIDLKSRLLNLQLYVNKLHKTFAGFQIFFRVNFMEYACK